MFYTEMFFMLLKTCVILNQYIAELGGYSSLSYPYDL